MRYAEKLLLAILSIIIAFPLLYAFSLSLFSPMDFTDQQAHLLPSGFSFENYRMALGNRYYPLFVFNSIITAALLALLRLAISIAAAFAFTHLRFRGKRIVLSLLLITMFIPPDALLYPNYSTIRALGLLDTYAAIIMPSLFSASSLLMLLGIYSTYDRNIYDAAVIDGAGDIRYILNILMPLTRSIAAAIFLQTFITGFNSYLWPLLVTSRMGMRTVQVGISMLGFAESGEYGAQFAAIMMITFPFLIILLIVRKKLMKTLSGNIIN